MSLPTTCPGCGHPAAEGQRFCRGCGAELAAAPVSGAGFAPAPSGAPDGRNTRLFVALALLLVFVFFANVKLPSSRDRAEAKKRACIENLRLIEAAVKTYLAAKGNMGGVMCDLKTLRHEGYLASDPVCPANGNYMIKVSMAGAPPPYGPPPGAPGSLRVEAKCTIHQGIADTTSGL